MGRDFKLRSSAREYGAQSSRRWFSRFRDAALIAMCVLAPSLLVSACGQKNAFIPPPPPKVDVAVPLKQTVTRYLTATGNTAAVNSTTLVARVQGFIQAIKYNDGDSVKAGTVLFVIEQKPYQLALEQAEAGQSSAAASTKQTEADYKRQSDLAAKNISSQATLDQATAAKDAAVAKQKQSEVDIEQAKLNLSYTEVKAPFDGIVTAREVSMGQLVGAGSATPLATIVQSGSDLRELRRQRKRRAEHPRGHSCAGHHPGRAQENSGRGRSAERDGISAPAERSTMLRPTSPPPPAR